MSQMRVGVVYWNEKEEAMFVTKMDKDGTIHSSSKPKNRRPFSFDKAATIQYIIESEIKLRARKVYE